MQIKKPLAFAFASVVLLLTVIFVNRSNASILSLPHKTVKLQNGLQIVLVNYPSPGVISYQLPVHVGSGNEVEKGKSGFAHFFEHLMFRGTKNMTGKEFGQLYVRLGVENNAWTWYDMTNYHGMTSTQNLREVLEAEADRFMNLYFDETQLRDESGAVRGEYDKSMADPDSVLEEKLREVAFKVHPYGHTTLGYKEDILAYPERYQDVWPFFRRYYRPSNVKVVLVGDVDFERDLQIIEKAFSKWKDPENLDLPTIPVEPEQTEAREKEVKLDKDTQMRLTLAYKSPAFSTQTRDTAALRVLSEIYFSDTSEFQREYKYAKAYLDSASAGALDSVFPGLFQIDLKLTSQGEAKAKEVQNAVEKVLDAIAHEGPSPEKLKATQRRLKNEALISWFGDPEQLASKITWYMNYEPETEVLDRYIENIQNVTANDISDVAKKYLVDSRKTVISLRGEKPL